MEAHRVSGGLQRRPHQLQLVLDALDLGQRVAHVVHGERRLAGVDRAVQRRLVVQRLRTLHDVMQGLGEISVQQRVHRLCRRLVELRLVEVRLRKRLGRRLRRSWQ